MRTIKEYIYFVLLPVSLFGCIDRYYLEDEIDSETKLVIDCTITDEDEDQYIKVSLSTSTEDSDYNPYSDCEIEVIDSLGNSFSFTESDSIDGKYEGTIDLQYLYPGASFQLSLITPDSKVYKSNFETMLATPPVDSLYYELATQESSYVDYTLNGVQFYLDFKTTKDYPTKYMYWIIETWEYHSTWPIYAYLSDSGFVAIPKDYTYYTCYKSLTIDDIYLINTSNFSENIYYQFELPFISDETQRLLYNYSLLVKQVSLSDNAYTYWKTLKSNNQDETGLYAKQPSTVKGNVYNVNDSEEHVLGYFGVSSVSKKRITLTTVEELSFDEVSYCEPQLPTAGYPAVPRPLYLVRMQDPENPDGNLVWGYVDTECVICTELGGVLEKPDFFE